MGLPTIAYVRDEDLGFLDPAMRADLPIVQAEPATIEAVLREWATAPAERLAAQGERSRAYVRRWHGADHVAARTEAAYRAALGQPATSA